MIEPPPLACAWCGYDGLHAEAAAELVDPPEQLDLVDRHPLDVAEPQDAGVVGEHVDRAEALVGVLDQRAPRRPGR